MPDARPRLEVVTGGGGGSPAPAPARRSGGGAYWLLVAVLLIALAGLFVEVRRNVQLSQENAELQTAVGELSERLASAESDLEAYRVHLAEVRQAVAELDDLLAREPAGAPPAP